MYISIATCDAHGTSKSTWVRQPKTHNANHIERATFKVRLRFMFHYRIFVERRLLFAAYLPGVCDPESAAFGCNKNQHC